MQPSVLPKGQMISNLFTFDLSLTPVLNLSKCFGLFLNRQLEITHQFHKRSAQVIFRQTGYKHHQQRGITFNLTQRCTIRKMDEV